MPVRLFNPLFFLIAKSTHSEMARQIQYLKVENQILRARLPKYIQTTPAERARLLKFGKPLGAAIMTLITIVHPRTFVRWVNDETAKPLNPPKGRPRIRKDVEALVVRIARETGWGYTRILGELRKLGFDAICRSTVKNILDRHGIVPGPVRSEGTWDQFIRSHAESLWACDYFTKKVWTSKGLRTFYILFTMHIGTRRVRILGHTESPRSSWSEERSRELRDIFDDESRTEQILLHDRDTKFPKQFDRILEQAGHKVIRIVPYSPNLNGHAERWIQSIKFECLNHFIVFGERHLQYLLAEYADYYNTQRPHSSCQHLPPSQIRGQLGKEDEAIRFECRGRLGGLLKHYEGQAA